jgi:hypothetical protein
VQAIERANEVQISYLNGFRRAIVGMTAAGVIARAALYAGAITGLFYATVSRVLGLPDLPAQPGVLTSCLTHCHCRWDIVTLAGNGNWDCYWIIDRAVENCPECIRRSEEFNPLQIRNGIIQPFNPIGIYKIA